MIITTSRPSCLQGGDRRGGVGLDGVGDGEDAGGPAVERDEDRRLALCLQTLGLGAPAARGRCPLAQQAPRADQQAAVLDRGAQAAAGDRVEVASVWAGEARAPRPRRRSPRRAGARRSAPPPATRRSSSSSPRSPTATTSVRAGSPRVIVPVLSRTIDPSLCAVSSASAERIRMPLCGALAGADHDRERRRQARARRGRR